MSEKRKALAQDGVRTFGFHNQSQALQMLLELKLVDISYRILHGRCRAACVQGRAPVAEDNSPGSSHIASNTCHYEFPLPVLRP